MNLLFIDQPTQVGFSYDTLTNVTASLSKEPFEGWDYSVADFSDGVQDSNLTFITGTTGSLNVTYTANTTNHAAVAIWHFAQTWFEEFPYYKPADEQISLFTESYGGHYGPVFVSFFMRQNERIANGSISGPGVHYMHMNTLGIINGCIDLEEQVWSYATFAVNNTYNIKAFNDTEYHHAMYELGRPDGIIDRIRECRRMSRELDRDNRGNVDEVNEYCSQADKNGEDVTAGRYLQSRRYGWYDITHPGDDPFPHSYLEAYLNEHDVQQALGAPVNFSGGSPAVGKAFGNTGDMVKGELLADLAYVLDHGVKVAMIYGDRDYA